jgi:aminoglycoside phosphotransferase (APT) family kinase protein
MQHAVAGWPAGVVDVSRLSGGSSASLFRISADGRHAVLRAPQIPPRPDSLRALTREARVLRALSSTNVPHAGFIDYCEDDSVVGTPFLLTEWVNGWVGSGPVPPRLNQPRTAERLALSLVDALAQLHALDYRAVGLDGFGRPEGFLARQVNQWLDLFKKHGALPHSRELPDVSLVSEWLRLKIPESWPPGLIHCDASFSNVMFCNDTPPKVAALIDWEIATIGDPRVDMGRALYPFPDERGIPGVSLMLDHSGGPTRQALVAHYARRSGKAVRDLDFFMVLAMFKLASLIEPNYSRDIQGLDPTGFCKRVAEFVPQLLAGARAIIEVHERTPGVRTA